MITLDTISLFLDKNVPIAFSGVSRNTKKYSSQMFLDLEKNGYQVIPVNPFMSEVGNKKCYNSVTELPSGIEKLIVCNNKKDTDKIVEEAINKGIKQIWIQQMSETKSAIEKAQAAGIKVISRECVYMFAMPTGIHGFHKSIKKFFGALPK
ncbi:MAG: CoA-binding protein [Bacteroidales bacterium]|nr:CoA-binding protein [Bacteroidales bacterium]